MKKDVQTQKKLAWPLVWLVAYNLLSWSELLTNRAIRFSHLATLFSVHEKSHTLENEIFTKSYSSRTDSLPFQEKAFS